MKRKKPKITRFLINNSFRFDKNNNPLPYGPCQEDHYRPYWKVKLVKKDPWPGGMGFYSFALACEWAKNGPFGPGDIYRPTWF